MTKTLSMVSHKNYNLNANEGFVMFLASKLITCFIDGCTSKIKSRWIAHILNGSEQIYWVLDLEGEVHSIWELWISGLQECKGNGLFEVGRNRHKFSVGSKNSWSLFGGLPLPGSTFPKKLIGGGWTPTLNLWCSFQIVCTYLPGSRFRVLGLLWHCPCILEGHLFTNLMLSALHLQGSKSNMCVCVCTST